MFLLSKLVLDDSDGLWGRVDFYPLSGPSTASAARVSDTGEYIGVDVFDLDGDDVDFASERLDLLWVGE
jgi:hypothetical protein